MTCPLCESPIRPGEPTEAVLGMPCHVECAKSEREEVAA